jgi:hypothetical protein
MHRDGGRQALGEGGVQGEKHGRKVRAGRRSKRVGLRRGRGGGEADYLSVTRECGRRAAPTCAHRSSAKRWSTRAESAGDRPGLGGRRSDPSGAPRRRALHMLRQHTSVPRTLAHDDVWTTPPHPRPRQEREARLAPSVSSSAKRTTSSTSPPPSTERVVRGGASWHAGVASTRWAAYAC